MKIGTIKAKQDTLSDEEIYRSIPSPELLI